MSAREADVVVQGAGMVGLTAAVALARQGLSVTLLDRNPLPTWRKAEYALRVSAINVASERLLAGLDAWAAIVAARVSPFRAIYAEDAAGGGSVRFDSADLGEPHLGHIVENELVASVLSRAAQHAGVRVITPGRVVAWDAERSGLTLRLEDGRRLATRLLVGADGACSAVRDQAGITVARSGYGQRALVAAVTTQQSHEAVARQRFLAGGPLAFLPLADDRCSIVWSLPEMQAEALAATETEPFCELLTEASGAMLGQITAIGERAHFPLQQLHADRYVADRVALVGDAAHVIHPLAGQGVNLGLMDAAVLAQVVADAHRRGRDPGAQSVLRRYERSRRGDNLLMQEAMDAFHQVFTRGNPALVRLRSVGFDLTNRLTPVKRLFMRRAMGLRGELPRLARR